MAKTQYLLDRGSLLYDPARYSGIPVTTKFVPPENGKTFQWETQRLYTTPDPLPESPPDWGGLDSPDRQSVDLTKEPEITADMTKADLARLAILRTEAKYTRGGKSLPYEPVNADGIKFPNKESKTLYLKFKVKWMDAKKEHVDWEDKKIIEFQKEQAAKAAAESEAEDKARKEVQHSGGILLGTIAVFTMLYMVAPPKQS